MFSDRVHRINSFLSFVALSSLFATGCSFVPPTVPLEPGALTIPAQKTWTATPITVEAGHPLQIAETADGAKAWIDGKKKHAVNARGTYCFDLDTDAYPLEPNRPANDHRYPGYCLMGRIGEKGTPFFIGSHFEGKAPESGTLYLGINDPAPQANLGAFHCRVTQDALHTSNQTTATLLPPTAPHPVKDANVVIIWVDGLRPDVVEEMARWGHLPNIRSLFLENGTWLRNSFSVHPSLTVTNFTSMITGLYSNRHGVKSQCYFDRNAGNYFNGLDARYFTHIASEVDARGVRILFDYYPNSFSSTALPFEKPRRKILEKNLVEWFHRALNVANYSSNIPNKIDEAQTRFAVDLASSPQIKTMFVWLPANDKVSERTPHGQWGGSRGTLARVDQNIGKIVERLKIRQRFDNTYFILISDHGHVGGNEAVNHRFDIEREIFHAHLNMNVVSMLHRFDYPGAPAERLGAISDSDGAVGVYLPVGNVDSRDLSRPNTYQQLMQYGLPDGKRVNAVELFTEHTATERWPLKEIAKRPIDFSVSKVDDNTVLLYKSPESQALISARKNNAGVLEFQYQPVRRYAPNQPLETISSGDPLGYLDSADFHPATGSKAHWIANYHTGTEWLQATYKTQYPGCVNTLNLYFRWDGPVNSKSPVPSQPDILLFTNKGWIVEPVQNQEDCYEETVGTRHGMAFREASNNSFFLSGPGIRKGAISETPHRMVDLLPTVMEFLGQDPASANLDGQAIREIWESK